MPPIRGHCLRGGGYTEEDWFIPVGTTLVDDVVTSLRTGAEALFRGDPQRLMALVVCSLLMLGPPGAAGAEPEALAHPVLSGRSSSLTSWTNGRMQSWTVSSGFCCVPLECIPGGRGQGPFMATVSAWR